MRASKVIPRVGLGKLTAVRRPSPALVAGGRLPGRFAPSLYRAPAVRNSAATPAPEWTLVAAHEAGPTLYKHGFELTAGMVLALATPIPFEKIEPNKPSLPPEIRGIFTVPLDHPHTISPHGYKPFLWPLSLVERSAQTVARVLRPRMSEIFGTPAGIMFTGWKNLKFLQPVRPGETLLLSTKILPKRTRTMQGSVLPSLEFAAYRIPATTSLTVETKKLDLVFKGNASAAVLKEADMPRIRDRLETPSLAVQEAPTQDLLNGFFDVRFSSGNMDYAGLDEIRFADIPLGLRNLPLDQTTWLFYDHFGISPGIYNADMGLQMAAILASRKPDIAVQRAGAFRQLELGSATFKTPLLPGDRARVRMMGETKTEETGDGVVFDFDFEVHKVTSAPPAEEADGNLVGQYKRNKILIPN